MTPLLRLRAMGLALAAAIYAVDQLVKWHLMDNIMLPLVEKIELLAFFDLRFTRNYGVSLGLLTAESVEMRWGLIVLTSVIALGVLVWMFRETAKADILGLAMVLGGAAGNIKDRLDYGFVVDYADLHFGDFRPFLIFNIADACITIGVLIILARSFLSREKPDEKAATES